MTTTPEPPAPDEPKAALFTACAGAEAPPAPLLAPPEPPLFQALVPELPAPKFPLLKSAVVSALDQIVLAVSCVPPKADRYCQYPPTF